MKNHKPLAITICPDFALMEAKVIRDFGVYSLTIVFAVSKRTFRRRIQISNIRALSTLIVRVDTSTIKSPTFDAASVCSVLGRPGNWYVRQLHPVRNLHPPSKSISSISSPLSSNNLVWSTDDTSSILCIACTGTSPNASGQMPENHGWPTVTRRAVPLTLGKSTLANSWMPIPLRTTRRLPSLYALLHVIKCVYSMKVVQYDKSTVHTCESVSTRVMSTIGPILANDSINST